MRLQLFLIGNYETVGASSVFETAVNDVSVSRWRRTFFSRLRAALSRFCDSRCRLAIVSLSFAMVVLSKLLHSENGTRKTMSYKRST